MEAETIDDVIAYLGDIIINARHKRSRLGFFPALYRLVTIEIKARCEAGYFNNNALIHDLDVVFANYYFRAYEQYTNGQQPTKSWAVAFHAAKSKHPLALQHLLLGMNAHISFDLGQAVVDASEGQLTPDLREDFDDINAILAAMIDNVQNRLRRVSPMLGLLDALSRFDEMIAAFSIQVARDGAWHFAERLVEQAEGDLVAQRDEAVARVSQRVLHPRGITRLGVWLISLTERKQVPRVLDALEAR